MWNKTDDGNIPDDTLLLVAATAYKVNGEWMNAVSSCHMIFIGCYVEDNGKWFTDNLEAIKVSHWMKLPEVPG